MSFFDKFKKKAKEPTAEELLKEEDEDPAHK